jgi:hypothetical protein
VHAVALQVVQVIDDVDRAGQQAEQQKPGQRAQERDRIAQAELPVKDHRGQQESVLGPLAGTHAFDQRGQHAES